MLRRFILSLAALVALALSAWADCPRCHGSGRIVAVPNTSAYGVSNRKVTCPYCDRKVLPGHMCECPRCHGTGNASGHEPSRGGGDDTPDFTAMGLTPEEFSEVKTLTSQLMQRFVYYDDCPVCHGTKICQTCRNGVNPICLCHGTLKCYACNGTGKESTPRYRGVDEETKAKLEARIREITERAARRLSDSGSGSSQASSSSSSSSRASSSSGSSGSYGPWSGCFDDDDDSGSPSGDSEVSDDSAIGSSAVAAVADHVKSLLKKQLWLMVARLVFWTCVIVAVVWLAGRLVRARRGGRRGRQGGYVDYLDDDLEGRPRRRASVAKPQAEADDDFDDFDDLEGVANQAKGRRKKPGRRSGGRRDIDDIDDDDDLESRSNRARGSSTISRGSSSVNDDFDI